MHMSCPGYRMSRRSMLATGAGASLLGLPVRHLLARAGSVGPARAEHVILFWNGGGMSHVELQCSMPYRNTHSTSTVGISQNNF